MGDIDATLVELDRESESAKLGLIVQVDQMDEVLFGVSPSSLSQKARAVGGVLGLVGDGRGLGWLAVVASLVGRFLEVGVNGLAEWDILLFMVAFIVAMGSDLGRRLTFGIFGLVGSVRLRKGVLRRVGQCPGGSGLLLIVSADLLPEMIVKLFEADLLVVEPLDVDAGEGIRVSISEVLHIVSGEINAGGQLAIVLLLGLLDEG